MPNYPVSDLSERLLRALTLLNWSYTIPFRVLLLAGLLISPFLGRIRWMTLPLFLGLGLWANTASYDLRNLLSLLLISGFISVYAVTRSLFAERVLPSGPRWKLPDGAVAATVAAMAVGFTLTLAKADAQLNERFAIDQLRGGSGVEINTGIEKLLRRGCIVFSADDYISTVSAFRPFRDRMDFFHYSLPLDQSFADRINKAAGCTSIIYPPSITHASILDFIGC